MRRAMIVAGALVALAVLGSTEFAEARRMGGGKSLGTQRQSIAPQQTPAPPATAPSGAATQPVMPASPATAAAAKAGAPAAAPAASGASRWLGPIAGLAAGLGLAALLSHFGLSEGFASLLLVALLIGGAFLLVRMLLARRAPSPAPLRYAGGPAPGGAHNEAPMRSPTAGGPRIEPVLKRDGAASASSGESATGRRWPPGFDADAFARTAKQQFVALQAAHDAADRKALAAVMTPPMFDAVAADLEGRGAQVPTEVVSLQAEVLDVATEGNDHWASVRYTGTLREDGDAALVPIDEVWNLTKPVDGSSGWLLAGIQQRH